MSYKWNRANVPFVTFQLAGRLFGYEPIAVERDGKWLIGYGSSVMPNGQPVKQGDTITTPAANAMMSKKLEDSMQSLLNDVNWQLNDLQAATLILFLYLHGNDAFSNSIISRMANSGRLDLVGGQIGSWSSTDGEAQQNEYLRQLFVGETRESAVSHQAIKTMPLAALARRHADAKAETEKWLPAAPVPEQREAEHETGE